MNILLLLLLKRGRLVSLLGVFHLPECIFKNLTPVIPTVEYNRFDRCGSGCVSVGVGWDQHGEEWQTKQKMVRAILITSASSTFRKPFKRQQVFFFLE